MCIGGSSERLRLESQGSITSYKLLSSANISGREGGKPLLLTCLLLLAAAVPQHQRKQQTQALAHPEPRRL